MLQVYGALMPVRLLEEIRFWKQQEKEHTSVITAIIPNLEQPFVNLMREWENVFDKTEQAAQGYLDAALQAPTQISPQFKAQINDLLRVSCEQSNRFIAHLRHIERTSQAVKQVPLAPTVLEHIIRESEYFLNVLQTLTHLDAREGDQRGERQEDGMPWNESAPEESRADNHPSSSHDETAGNETTGDEAPINEVERGDLLSWTDALDMNGKPVPIGGHQLPPLPYPYNALEPYIDEATMRIHHDKHHKSYVDGLNKAERALLEARRSGNFDLIKHWEGELAFHGSGHYLHTIFWNVMSPKGGGKPSGPLAAQIKQDFGSYEQFKAQFTEAADKTEGGGWAILVWSPRSWRLEILQAEKHQNRTQWDVIPLLPLDVWEHSYYLKHQDNRAAYIQDWWNVVYWPYVADRFSKAKKLKWIPY